MSTLEIAAALLRGTHVAALMSLFGTLAFLTIVVPSAVTDGTIEAESLRRRLQYLARVSTAVALIFGAAWLTLESAVIAGVDSVAMTLHALTVVASRTQFGQWVLVRGVLLVAVLPFLRPWRAGHGVAFVIAAAALSIQPMLSHPGAIGGGVGTALIMTEILHLLAAGAWLGGLFPLFITIGALPHDAAATACRGFTPIGLSAVLVLAGTATVQVLEFVGGLPGLLGTGYGHLALVKLGLFVVLLGLAALNRLSLTDRLAGTAPGAARRHMRISVAVEIVLGLFVVITAAFLASQEPGSHEQPVWPFLWRPSVSVFQEPDLRGEVIAALVAIGVAVAIAAVGLIWRRVRWPALAAAILIVVLAVPHLDLLFVEAYPTSFYTSPTDFAATSVVHGEKLFETKCVTCHGPEGRGDGPAAKSLPVSPADLTASHFLAHSEGDLFWYIAHGIDAPMGQAAMPGFSGAISSEGIWALVDYLRAHHAGITMQEGGSEDELVAVPQFDAVCADGATLEQTDMRGQVLRIVAMPDNAPPPAALPRVDGVNIRTILLARHPPMRPSDSTCVTVEPEAWTAFAILLGITPDELTGTEILADRDLWLRALWKSGDAGDWADPMRVIPMIRDMVAHPLSPSAGSEHGHHH